VELTNRDVAFLIWLTAAAAFVLARSGGRKAIAGILGALRGKVALVLVTFATYIVGLVAVAYLLGFWKTALLKDTVAWLLVPGMVLLFGFKKAYEGRGYYGRTLIQVIGLTAIVGFYVNLAAFPLWAELALLPAVVFLGALSAVAGLKPEAQVAKRFVDGLAAIIGFVILIGTAVYVVREWDVLDKVKLALSFALPIWLTAATLPFIFGFSLFANYEMAFSRIDFFSKDNPQGRRRAKLALLASYQFRNRELHRFAGLGPQELARSTSWGEARRIIAFYRAKARLEEAEKDLKAKRLARYAGVEGTDWEGRPLDQREFDETRAALDMLHTFHAAQHKNGRYRKDLMAAVGGLLSKTFPETEIVVTIGPKERSWFAWRRTISGWVLGIGAAAAPPDKWTWEGPEPPNSPPGPRTDWTHRGFDEDEA
jgi:hypothetical protein